MALSLPAKPLVLLVMDSHGASNPNKKGNTAQWGWGAGDSRVRPDLSIGSATEQLCLPGQVN